GHMHSHMLNAFPTRRSSDLLEPFPGGPGPERGFDERHQHVAVKDAIAVGREAQIALPLRVLDRATEERPELLGEDRDDQVAVARGRKSTRLNSSHVKISYAV